MTDMDPVIATSRHEPSWMILSASRCGLGPDRPASAYPKELAQTIMARRTQPGDWILDPFSGWGTSAEVAREIGLFCLGIEIDQGLAEESASAFTFPSKIIQADSRNKLLGDFPCCQLLITSSPLFLDDPDDTRAVSRATDTLLATLLAQRHLLTATATIAVEALIASFPNGTTRAYQVAFHNAISRHFRYIGETIFCCGSGDSLPGGFSHIYVLEFANN